MLDNGLTQARISPDSDPRLSIIIATKQAGGTLERCIKSILDQDFHDWELLIADAASDDDTLSVIRKFEPFISWWRSRPDEGLYAAWNEALSMARGEYVTFLGADDVWHSSATLSQVFQRVGDAEYDLITGHGNFFDLSGKVFEIGGAWDYKRVTRRITVCHPGCLHRRELFARFGLFDTSYRIAADYDFILRLPENTRTLHIPIPLVDISDGGISRRSRWATLRERYRAQARCPRVGSLRAAINFADKLWRIPVARLLGIPS
jgi:glycosyltransferase involved in cell wall biosynthesis